MSWCPPRSALFPYTTLFRSRQPRQQGQQAGAGGGQDPCATRRGEGCRLSATHPRPPAAGPVRAGRHGGRSEEHTSELQSRENLVCRLLLEKKNKEQAARRVS